MKFEDYLNEAYSSQKTKEKSPKQMAKEIVGNFWDDIPYQVKEYFGGWPQDIIGVNHKELYKWIYKEIAKLARDEGKKYS